MTEEILYKRRSSIACLADALDLMNNNIATILRKCWPYMLATALLSAAIVTAMINIFAGKPLMINGIVTAAASVAAIVAYSLFYEKIISGLSVDSFIDTSKRIAMFMLIMIAVTVVFIALVYGIGYALGVVAINHLSILKHINIIVTILSILVSVAFIVVLIPFVYVGMKYFYGNTTVRKFCKEYKTGMHYFFYILGTSLLLLFVIAIIGTIVGLPITILFNAAISSSASTMIGDPSDLPSKFSTLTFAVAFVVSLIYALISIWELLVARYIYGSIEKRKEMQSQADKVE